MIIYRIRMVRYPNGKHARPEFMFRQFRDFSAYKNFIQASKDDGWQIQRIKQEVKNERTK